jgi:hypothetical protein
MSRSRPAISSVAIVAIAAAVVITGCVPAGRGEPAAPAPAAPPGRLFTGDYSTGDFSQWPNLENRGYHGDGANYVPSYSATVVDDPTKGKAARFELRPGDLVGDTERTEVAATVGETGSVEGQTRWYAFSTKFDPTFPIDHATLGWGLTNQWHADSNSGGSPPFGMYVDQLNDNWSLTIQKQSSPGVYLDVFPIWNTPLDRGRWHDVKMEVKFSTSDAIGWIRLWHDGIRQRFLDGSDTYAVRTLIPNTTTVYYKEGYYREPIAPIGIVYHSGFRCADSEAAL